MFLEMLKIYSLWLLKRKKKTDILLQSKKYIGGLMKISAGILFVKNGQILLCHVTGYRHWDLPKGQPREDEELIDAAIRECEEETGFIVEKEDLKYCGIVPYNKYKELALFVYVGKEEDYPNVGYCKCTSYLDSGEPEVDDFEYFPLKDLSYYTVESMRKAISYVLNITEPTTRVDERNSKIFYKR